MNIETRKLFEEFEVKSNSVIEDTGSKRDMFHTVILNNDRKSYVQRIMGKYQKVDRYLKDVKNGNEEALIRNIEKQQKLRMMENKKGHEEKNIMPETLEKRKVKKKEGILERK